MVAPLDEVDDAAVLDAVPLVDPAPAEPVGVPEAVAVDIVEPVDAVEPVEAVEAVEAVDMPEVDIETEDPPPEAGDELVRVNVLDCERISLLVDSMRLTWNPPPVPVRLFTV